MSRTHIPPNAQGNRAVLEGKLIEHDNALDAAEIKSKYLLAWITPSSGGGAVHMNADADEIATLTGLGVLSGAATQAQADTYAETMRASFLRHFLDAGASPTVDAAHQSADTSDGPTLTAIPTATNFAKCKTLVLGLRDAIIGHGEATLYALWHFHDDIGFGGSGFVLTVADPLTLGNLITDLNDVRTALMDHCLNASS